MASKSTVTIVALVALAGAAAGACRRPDRDAGEATESPSQPKRVRCAPLVEQDIEDTVEVRGNIAPPFGKDALIAPQVEGRILRVTVREGDRVRAGQELARIDDATLVDQARQSDAVIAKAEAETALARTTEARVKRVFDRGIAARQEWEDAGARLATARANEAEVRASAAIARRALARASVRSPLSGVVLRVFRRPGELVDGTPATPIVEVGDPAHLELVASVSAADLVRIRLAAPARVDVPVLPNRPFVGHVTMVSPAVDRATGLGAVRVDLELKGVDAPPIGVTGIAGIQTGRHARRLLAPAVALRAPSGSDAEILSCGRDGRAHVLRVRVGRAHAGLVEVSPAGAPVDAGVAVAGPEPFSPGAAVVVDPVLGINDGDAIERQP